MFEEVSPEIATWSAEMALDDKGRIIEGTIQLSERKRRKEVFGEIEPKVMITPNAVQIPIQVVQRRKTIYRASSEQEVKDFHTHWSKDRV